MQESRSSVDKRAARDVVISVSELVSCAHGCAPFSCSKGGIRKPWHPLPPFYGRDLWLSACAGGRITRLVFECDTAEYVADAVEDVVGRKVAVER